MQKRLLFIPIDDRPCTCKMPVRMAGITNWQVVTPPAELLGRAYRPGDCSRILRWLSNTSEHYDASIISVDMLLFGGLIASRRTDAPFEIIRERLRQMEVILRDKKDCLGRIYLFKTIMRAAPTYTDESTVPVIKKLVELSCLRYKARHGLPCACDRVIQLEKEIPPDFLDTYLKARARNHEINRHLLEFMKEGPADFLLYGIDDSKTTGLNVLEKEELEDEIRERNLHTRVLTAPGTDETALLLLARAVNELADLTPRVHTVYSHPRGKTIIPAYEDRSFEEIISVQIRAARCTSVDSTQDADIILFVHNPQDMQREAAYQGVHPRSKKGGKTIVSSLKKAIDEGKRTALVDVFYANGADAGLMCELVCKINIADLYGFAAWNTAGNSVGTSLAHASIRFAGEKLIATPCEEEASTRAHLALLLERFADDWFYQAVVRQQVSAEAVLRRVSVFHLDEHTNHFDLMIRNKMVQMLEKFYKNHIRGKTVRGLAGRNFVAGNLEKLSVKLPWDRLFEVDIDLDFTLSKSEPTPLLEKPISPESCLKDYAGEE